MGRFRKQLLLNVKDEEVEAIMQDFLLVNHFYEGNWLGEGCYASRFTAKQSRYFKYTYDQGILRIEAWLPNGKTGESDLQGFANAFAKAPYLKIVTGLIEHFYDTYPLTQAYNGDLLEKERKVNRFYWWLIPMICVLCILFIFFGTSGKFILFFE